MASCDKSVSESGKPDFETPPPPPPKPASAASYFMVDVALRILLFMATLVAVVVMVTSKQTKWVTAFPAGVPRRVRTEAKFDNSPAFIYFVAALSIACLYSILTILASFLVILKPFFAKTFLLGFALMDILIFGLVASATGTAGGVAYVGLKGNDHVGWAKICNNYDKFCDHIAGSLAMSLLASVLLMLLVMFSVYSIHCRVRR